MTREEFEKICFETYQLDWMISHGVTVDNIISDMCDIACEAVSEDPRNAMTDEQSVRRITKACRSVLFNDRGFGNGSMWVCKDEFLGAEFKDPDYMQHLISLMPNSKEMESFWRKEYGVYMYEPGIEIQTSAGVIKAYENPDPGQPGIAVILQPAGTEYEIDLSFVSVYEDPDYATAEGERPVDVSIMTYADPFSEDYTSKSIVRRENVVEALSIGKA